MQRQEQHNKVLRLAVAALMVALVFWGSKMEVVLPLSVGGNSRFHLGNSMCALAGILLGPWWGGLAAGLGSALYDATSPIYITEAPITFCTKGLYGLISGGVYLWVFRQRVSHVAILLSTTVAAVGYIVIYLLKTFFYNSMLLEGMGAQAALVAVIAKLPSALFNGAVAVVIAPILGFAVVKAVQRAHMDGFMPHTKQ